MTAYSFKRQFVAPILAGTKRQTIRAERTGRSRHARPGEELQLYVGMRTRFCRRIALATCTSVQPISLIFWGQQAVVVDGVPYTQEDVLDGFARSDGFGSWDDMRAFWFDVNQTVDEFSGVMIRWEEIREPMATTEESL